MPGIMAEAMQSMMPIMQKQVEAIRQCVEEQVEKAEADATEENQFTCLSTGLPLLHSETASATPRYARWIREAGVRY